jgi:hypothetical protein
MSDAPDGIITATATRLAVKAKISAGDISQRSVSLLIHDYAMQKPRDRRRSPVDDIPAGRREAFLGALDTLSSETDRQHARAGGKPHGYPSSNHRR